MRQHKLCASLLLPDEKVVVVRTKKPKGNWEVCIQMLVRSPEQTAK